MVYKALIIAVDQYSSVNNLPNTVNDAVEIKRLLLESPSFFNDQDVQVFQGSISRKDILQSALRSFFISADSSDILFLFWAGHGAFVKNEGYFVPFDADINSPQETMIKMTEVRDLIEQTSAKTVLSFFDTCHSGAVARNIQREMVRGLEVKGSGKVLIAACTEQQVAWDRTGHGAFTDYLIKGLEGKAADRNGDIDVYNLYSYVSKKLNEEFGNQNPVIKSTLNGVPLLLKRTVSRGKPSLLTNSKTDSINVNNKNTTDKTYKLEVKRAFRELLGDLNNSYYEFINSRSLSDVHNIEKLLNQEIVKELDALEQEIKEKKENKDDIERKELFSLIDAGSYKAFYKACLKIEEKYIYLGIYKQLYNYFVIIIQFLMKEKEFIDQTELSNYLNLISAKIDDVTMKLLFYLVIYYDEKEIIHFFDETDFINRINTYKGPLVFSKGRSLWGYIIKNAGKLDSYPLSNILKSTNNNSN